MEIKLERAIIWIRFSSQESGYQEKYPDKIMEQ